jgi:LAO/AO transport system kinase
MTLGQTAYDLDQWCEKIVAGDIVFVSKAISLVESSKSEHQKLAQQLLKNLAPKTIDSLRIAITGTPGVGKSSHIETLGLRLIEAGHKVGVLAIDPSSQLTGGSILGDKTRMNKLAVNPNAYIRPSAAGKTLGGVTHFTAQSIIILEAAGFDRIIIETVGVGQSEASAAHLSDLFILLMQTGAGDDLQAIKRGILELADIVCITKADGQNLNPSESFKNLMQQSLQLLRSQAIPVVKASSLSLSGVDELISAIVEFEKKHLALAQKQKKRQLQLQYLVREICTGRFTDAVDKKINNLELNDYADVFKNTELILQSYNLA